MFHGFDYPDSIGKKELHSRFWHAVIRNGIVDYPDPRAPGIIRRFVREMEDNRPPSVGLNEKGLFE